MINTIEIQIWPQVIDKLLQSGVKAKMALSRKAAGNNEFAGQLDDLRVFAILGFEIDTQATFDGGPLERLGIPKDVLIGGAAAIKRTQARVQTLAEQMLQSPLTQSDRVVAIAEVQTASRSLATVEQTAFYEITGRKHEAKIRTKVLTGIEQKLLADGASGKAEFFVKNGQIRFIPVGSGDNSGIAGITQRDELATKLRSENDRDAISLKIQEERLKRRIEKEKKAMQDALLRAKEQRLPQTVTKLAVASGLMQGGEIKARVLQRTDGVNETLLKTATLFRLSRV